MSYPQQDRKTAYRQVPLFGVPLIGSFRQNPQKNKNCPKIFKSFCHACFNVSLDERRLLIQSRIESVRLTGFLLSKKTLKSITLEMTVI